MHWRCLQVKGQSTTSVIHTDRKRLERHLIYLPWNNITRKGKEEKEKGVKLCEITGKLMPRLSCSLVLTKHDCNLSTHRVFTQTRARQCATKLTSAAEKYFCKFPVFPANHRSREINTEPAGKRFFAQLPVHSNLSLWRCLIR